MKTITFTVDGFAPLVFDQKKHSLGKPCPRNHTVNKSGQSVRDLHNICIFCHRLESRKQTDLKTARGRQGRLLKQQALKEFNQSLHGQIFEIEGFKPLKFDASKHATGHCDRGHVFAEIGGKAIRQLSNCVFCSRIHARKKSKSRNEQTRQRARIYRRRQKLKALPSANPELNGVAAQVEGFLLFTFDSKKHYLGTLCDREHEFLGTKMSPRDNQGNCVFCNRLRSRYNNLQRYNLVKDDPEFRAKTKAYKNALYQSNAAVRANAIAKAALHKKTPKGQALAKKSAAKRQAILKNVHAVDVPTVDIETRFAEFDRSCAYCGTTEKLSLDHFISLSVGGSNCLGNFIPACSRCNSSKQHSDPYEWFKKQPYFSKPRWKKILSVLGKTEATYSQIPLF